MSVPFIRSRVAAEAQLVESFLGRRALSPEMPPTRSSVAAHPPKKRPAAVHPPKKRPAAAHPSKKRHGEEIPTYASSRAAHPASEDDCSTEGEEDDEVKAPLHSAGSGGTQCTSTSESPWKIRVPIYDLPITPNVYHGRVITWHQASAVWWFEDTACFRNVDGRVLSLWWNAPKLGTPSWWVTEPTYASQYKEQVFEFIRFRLWVGPQMWAPKFTAGEIVAAC